MHVLVAQHLPNLPITQRSLPLAHLARDLHARTRLLQKLHSRHPSRDRIVRRIKNLEAQAISLDAAVANLAEIARVDVAPGVTLAGSGRIEVGGEIAGVLVGLDDVADAEGVDIDAEAAGEGAGGALAAQLGGGVAVFRVDVVVLLEREGVVVDVALSEADAVRRLRAGDDDLLDPELARGLDDVVRAQHVAAEALVVRHQHIARVRGEVDHRVRRLQGRVAVLRHVEVGAQRVEDLPAVGKVDFHRVDVGIVERDQVEVEHFVPLGHEVGDHMAAGFAGPAGEDDAFACGCCCHNCRRR